MDILIYIIIGATGLIMSLLMLFFGELLDGVFDALDATAIPDGAVSGTTFSASLAGFGCAGTAAISFGVESDLTVLAIAFSAAILSWLITWGLYAILQKSGTKDGADNISNYVGLTGSVVNAPYREDSWGEMNLSTRGYTKRLYFRTNDTVKSGDAIKITTVVDSVRVTATRVNTE